MSENMPNKSQTVHYTKGSVFGVYGCDRISNKIVGKGGKTKCIMPNSKTMGDKKDICTQGITRLRSSIIELNIGAKMSCTSVDMWGCHGITVFQAMLCESGLMGIAISTSGEMANAS